MSSESLLRSDPESEHDGLNSYSLKAGRKSCVPRLCLGRACGAFWRILFMLLGIWGAISLIFQAIHYVQVHQTISCDCGSSVADALSRGCKYDTMSAAWLPDICRDDELSAEFDHMGPGPDGQWYYWADRNRTEELSILELSLLAESGRPFFTTWDWHVAHCTYRWRKLVRPGFLIANMDVVNAYHHIAHCEEVIWKHDRDQTIMSGVGLNGSTYS